MAINLASGDKCLSRRRRLLSGAAVAGLGRRRDKEERDTEVDDAARRRRPVGKLLPRAIVCCVCAGPLFRCLLTSWPLSERAGKDGRIQNDRHGLVTREVRSGFNRGLGAVGTLAVWLAAGAEGGKRERERDCVCACVFGWKGRS